MVVWNTACVGFVPLISCLYPGYPAWGTVPHFSTLNCHQRAHTHSLPPGQLCAVYVGHLNPLFNSPPVSRESTYCANIVCGCMDLSAALCISGDHVSCVCNWKLGLLTSWRWRFALPPLVLSTRGGTLELSGHKWLTHTWLTKEQKTIVVVSGCLAAVWSLYLQCILLVT